MSGTSIDRRCCVCRGTKNLLPAIVRTSPADGAEVVRRFYCEKCLEQLRGASKNKSATPIFMEIEYDDADTAAIFAEFTGLAD